MRHIFRRHNVLPILSAWCFLSATTAGAAAPDTDRIAVVVESVPPMATVFARGGASVTPFEISLAPEEHCAITLVHINCKDAEVLLDARELRAKGRQADAGRYVLTVPLLPQPAEAALAETRTEQPSDAKVIPLYRDLIRKNPGVLTHYAELAHHLLIRGDFKETADVLRQGAAAMTRNDASEQRRFLAELQNIYVRYFVYPAEPADTPIRPLCRKLMQECLDKRLWPRMQVERLMQVMDNYDRTHAK